MSTKKKTVWFEVQEDESIEDCLNRLSDAGYRVAGRMEEPVFMEKDGEYVPIRQVIKFKGILDE
ncbi:NETI motif-containing protein [Sporosarcina sp. ACRSL]|uniref:NETI motif-containing protein n=1 Tax=Sporosarcina sp. ACRSL TaxID=2918215 RepID=UPI001EF4C897|nr:NETI motif-containing protein [Sporosarcina sp. ACRSL]MCG7345623.1 NETI motif-containing protein [Sporosarcina sp. ACRSL]